MTNTAGAGETLARERRLLEHCALFAGLGALAVSEVVPQLETVAFQAEGHVFLEGEKGTALFIIAEGSVRVSKGMPDGHQAVVAQLGEGDVFGEMALVTHAPRTTSCEMVQPGRLWRLSRAAFDELATSAPATHAAVLRKIAVLLCQRLKRTTADVCQFAADLRAASEDTARLEAELANCRPRLEKVVTKLEGGGER